MISVAEADKKIKVNNSHIFNREEKIIDRAIIEGIPSYGTLIKAGGEDIKDDVLSQLITAYGNGGWKLSLKKDNHAHLFDEDNGSYWLIVRA